MEYYRIFGPANVSGFPHSMENQNKKTRHTDEQIVKILREATETSIAATACKHAITEQ